MYLQGKQPTIDLFLSLALTIAAAVTQNMWCGYAAMLVRSVSYQFVFERFVRNSTEAKGK